MQDRWYGDNRDLVKWATLVHLAETNRIESILQVAFYRADEGSAQIVTPSGATNVPGPVMRHFRCIDQIKGLESASSLKIEVLKQPFSANGRARENYFRAIAQRLRSAKRKPLMLFLDPDTGIAPKNFNAQHVRPEEIGTLHAALRKGDWLVFYQHQRREKGWRESTKRAFAHAVGAPAESVGVFFGKNFAKDVVFFAVKKGSV